MSIEYEMTEEMVSQIPQEIPKLKGNVDKLLKLLIFIALMAILVTAWTSGSIRHYKLFHRFGQPGTILFWITIIYSGFIVINLPFKAILNFLCKPCPVDKSFNPSISILIPAYNEGETIYQSIKSALLARYYGDKEIICIDDGSTDDTEHYINKFANEYPGSFKFIKFPKNRGKREALAEGVRAAKSEIIITLDSDTVIKEDALIHLVQPFQDKRIGATTASVKVLNRDSNLLTKMLGVRYTMAFDFYRSAQTTIKTVLVCSGVLSAYRKDLFDRVLAAWLNQYFLGKRCTYGDDRSLTNFILRMGYDTVYAKKSIAYTKVPETVGKFVKMQVRWNKSYIRESLIFASFMFTQMKKRYKGMAIFEFSLSNIIMILQYIIIGSSLFYIIIDPLYLFKFIITISGMGMIYMLFYIRIEKSTDFIYGILYSYFYVFLLLWLTPYALFKLRDSAWLTR